MKGMINGMFKQNRLMFGFLVMGLFIGVLFILLSMTSTTTLVFGDTPSLLSQGKPATASSSQSGNSVTNANDGNVSTRWAASSGTYPQWWRVDLGNAFNLTKVDINWLNSSSRTYKYKIEVSTNNTTYTTTVDKTNTTALGDTSDSFTASGRYVRITVTGCSAGGAYASAYEIKVYGTSSGTTVTPTPTPTITPTPKATSTPTPTPPVGVVSVSIVIPYVEYQEIVLTPADLNGTSLIKTQNTSQTVSVSYTASTNVTLKSQNGIGQPITFTTKDANGNTLRNNPLTVTVYSGMVINVEVVNRTSVTPTPSPVNLALNKPATASSTQAGLPANLAVDGNISTRWGSTSSDPQWYQVNLGSTQSIKRVILRWEVAYGKSYEIQTSDNATNWTPIYSTTSGKGGTEDLPVTGSGRYIRMYGTVRGTTYGYSLYEFEVYNVAAPTPSPTPTLTPTPIPDFNTSAPAQEAMVTNTRRPALSWQAVSNTTRYEVWLNISRTDYDWTAPGNLLDRYTKMADVTTNSYTLTSDLPDRWTYKWYIVAVLSSGGSKRSNIATFSVYLPTVETTNDGINIVNGCRDMNRNGTIEPFEDWHQPIETRINDLMSRMTIDEKAYQMFYNAKEYPLAGWQMGPCSPQDLVTYQLACAKTRLGIPLVSAGDTIHGYRTTYPAQSAMAASRDYSMMYKLGDLQRREQVPVGYRGVLGPLAELGTKVIYPRIQEGNGENAEVAAPLVRAFIAGFQGGPELNPASVLVTTKHWPGEGAGGEAGIVYDAVTIKYHMIPWRAAFEVNAGGVMPGYAGSSYLDPGGSGAGDSKPIIDYLRNNMSYDGLVTTDWLPSGTWIKAANAGSDVMGGANPGDITMSSFISGVPQSRIDEAVRRILRVKFKLGVFENPYGDPSITSTIWHTPENVTLARQAAAGCFTLLKNNGILPLNKLAAGSNIIVAGPRATDGPAGCLWTSYWHGEYGPLTILQAVQQRGQQAGVNVYQDTASNAKVAIVVVGEPSYTHGTSWPKEQPYLPADQLSIIQNFKNAGVPVVVVLVLPRPNVITMWRDLADAIVLIYRTGEENGIPLASLLWGDTTPKGKLPWQLPRDMSQILIAGGTDTLADAVEKWDLPYDLGATDAQRQDIRNKIDTGQVVPSTYGDPLYPYGYGMTNF